MYNFLVFKYFQYKIAFCRYRALTLLTLFPDVDTVPGPVGHELFLWLLLLPAGGPVR